MFSECTRVLPLCVCAMISFKFLLDIFVLLQGGNVRVPGGPLCSSCAMAKAPHLGCLGEA